jgi:hypothetical protein
MLKLVHFVCELKLVLSTPHILYYLGFSPCPPQSTSLIHH